MSDRDISQVNALTRESASDDQWSALWSNGWDSGIPGNTVLATHLSEHFGGIPGDWVNEGLIPDLPAETLRVLTVEQWREWLSRGDGDGC